MAREVLSLKDIQRLKASRKGPLSTDADVATTKKDEYLDRLLKYIPAEVVAVYLLVLELFSKVPETNLGTVQWIVFILFCFILVWYCWKILKIKKIQQIAISFIAFIIWVFTLQGLSVFQAEWYQPVYGEIILVIFTFLAAIWTAEKS